MLSKKLQEFFSTLSEEELRKVKTFITSPPLYYSLNSSKAIDLFKYLERYGFDFSHPSISKEVAFKYFFPDDIYTPNKKTKIDNLTSDLFNLLKRYVAQVEFEKDIDFYSGLALSRHYRLNGLHHRFEQSIAQVKKIISKSEERHSDYFYKIYQVENEISNYNGARNIYDQKNLGEMERSFDMHYAIVKYEYLIQLKLRKDGKGIEYPEPKHLEKYLNYLTDIHHKDPVPILVFYNLILSNLTSPTKESLNEYSDLLETIEPTLPQNSIKDFRALRRIFLSKVNYQKKDPEMLKRNFEVFKQDLRDGLLYYNNKINANAFRNIVPLGLKQNETEWVKKFLEVHPPERIFGTKFPKEIHSLKTAEYLFHLGQFNEALDKLEYRPYEDPHNSLLVDVLYLRIYFETQNGLIDFKLKSFEQKIRRAELSERAKSLYFNFFKKLDKIYRYGGIAKNKKKLEKVHYDLLYLPNIVEREWLIEKTEEALGYTPKHEDKEK